MSNYEKEHKSLRDKNNELVKKVQYWKMMAAQRQNEKLELMKENNELRLRLSRIRSGGAAQARKLDAALHATSKEALSHLVQASTAVARTVEIANTYLQDRKELDNMMPRWSSTRNTPTTHRVHRVHPLAIGGQSIQPVVSLSRTVLNNSGSSTSQSNVTERAVPMHMLQDVYIPLTRIDLTDLSNVSNLRIVNRLMDTNANDSNNSAEDLELNDSNEQDVSQNISETEEFDETRRLEAVTEDLEPDVVEVPVSMPTSENPFEGPSWMMDTQNQAQNQNRCTNLEPDSTTELEVAQISSEPGTNRGNLDEEAGDGVCAGVSAHAGMQASVCEFSPTVRRRKRTSSGSPPPSPSSPAPSLAPSPAPSPRTPYSPRPTPRRNSNNGRVLKVLVAKMRLDDGERAAAAAAAEAHADVSPPKRATRDTRRAEGAAPSRDASPQPPPARLSRDTERVLIAFDAPSPNGATDAHVIVSRLRDRIGSLALDVAWSPDGKRFPAPRGGGPPLVGYDAPSCDGATDGRVLSESTSDPDPLASGEPSTSARKIGDRDYRMSHESRTTNQSSHDKTVNRISHDSRTVIRMDESTNSRADSSGDSRGDVRAGERTASESGLQGSDGRVEQDSRTSHNGQDSDSGSGSEVAGEGRTRRQRKAVTYKEKPLNRKLRR